MSKQSVGRYQILGEIASGNQGTVYRAFDPRNQRLVAIKVLHASLRGDASYIERFHREATLAASIDHPNVVKILDVGRDDEKHYLTLEFLPENLNTLIESGTLPVANAAAIALGIAEGLGAMHALGIVHRDLKPQNVLFSQDGTPKVTDFGIARSSALPTMTATGVLMGTPYYMSPEQAEGMVADARSDVYALGCVLYQMLSGEVPFTGDTPLTVLRKHVEQQARPISTVRQDTPKALANVVDFAMSKVPADRYLDGAAMAWAIRTAVPGSLWKISQIFEESAQPAATVSPTPNETVAADLSRPEPVLVATVDAGSRVGEALQHPLTAISLFVAGLASIALIGLSPVRVDAEWAGIILATSLASAGTGFGYSLANRSRSANAPAERDRTGGA